MLCRCTPLSDTDEAYPDHIRHVPESVPLHQEDFECICDSVRKFRTVISGERVVQHACLPPLTDAAYLTSECA